MISCLIDCGQVTVGWRAPKSKDLYPMTALGILLEYLADTAVSPLQKVNVNFLASLGWQILKIRDNSIFGKRTANRVH